MLASSPAQAQDNTLGFEQGLYTVYEDVGTATLTVARGADVALGSALQLSYNTSGASANINDYRVVSNGSATIPANSLTGSISITILDDNVAEETEEFSVFLGGVLPPGATWGITHAIIRIVDDDGPAIRVSPTALSVAEGDAADYTVGLATPPTATVTIAISGHSSTDLSLDRTSLTFTTATWNTVQTVTVSAGQDADEDNDTATLLHTASSHDPAYAGETASVSVTVTDDEPRLTLSTTALGVAEGDDGEYTVRLGTQPRAQVTVAITGQADTDLTVAPALLTFTRTRWNTAQTVTVSAGEDDDGANDAATLLHTASSPDPAYAGETASVAVTVTDDDEVGLTLSTTALGVAEGGDGDYTVRLSTQPTATVTVAITGHSGTDLTLAPAAASLTFTTATWNTAQTVTVSAGEDDDGANDAATLVHTASGGDYAGETASVAVTVTDDDEVGLTLSTTALGVDEGDNGDYTVRLATQPTATVTVAITGHSGTDLTLAPAAASLTFTTASWNTAQTVTVSAGEDDDASNDAATLLHTASGGDYAGETASVAVTVTDDDEVGLTLSTTALGVDEGDNGDYTVRLATQPTATVTVAITGHSGTDLTLGATSLTFTTATWNTAQTVTVTAAQDDDGANDSATLVHTASGGDYAGETASVAVTVTDDDEVGLTLSTTALGVDEGDNGEYTVRLSTQPTAQVTVAITGQAGTDLTLDSTSLTFTTATWNTAQTVTVTAGEDDDGANDAATLLHTASGGDYAGETASVSVTVTDDDEVELTLSTTALGVDEGDNGEYTVRLSTQPTAQVTVAITGHSGTDLTLGATSLTFTTASWNTAQTVTVSAAQDDDASNDAATLVHTASGGDYAGETASVAVTVTDDDEVGLTLSTTALGVAEGGAGDYTVRLATQPTATVTVAITGHSGTDLTLAPAAASLTFTTASWNTVQTVTVSAGEDDDGANDSATLVHTASGGDYAGETASVAVTVTDDDEVGLTLSTTALGVDEGNDGEYTVRLATQPTATVTVAITGHSGTDLTLAPAAASLTFTTASWNTVQTVTVSAAEDDNATNDAATLLHTASGGDYAGETASVAVTVTDDDEVGLTLSTTALGVDEGNDGEYTVKLLSQPRAQVTVAITGQAGTDLTVAPALLTFTRTRWNTAQTVTVSAGEDDDGANDAATLLHTASSPDPAYAGETASVAVTVTDDDEVELTLSATALGVDEGDDGEYTVRLSTQPTATVTVAVTGQASTDLTLDTASLTFTTATWNTVQTVTVMAGEDDDGANDAATLLHTASGGDYAGETASVAVTVTDDDEVELTLSTTALGVAEGDDGEYTVRLSTQPTAQVTVAITGQAGTDLTLDATSLTFTTATWNTAQTVTVTAGEDDDGANDAATLLHTASGGDYAGETASVAVTVTDDDEVELTLSATALGVAEGADGEYTVRLSTQPTAQVTVAITGQAGTDLTLDSTSLTFTTATWNTAQTVTVTAGEDDDGANDAATLVHTATGGDYAGETASVSVTVTDDDDVELTLSATALGVAEGDDGEYTVRLSTQPTAQVTVAITGHSGTDLTLGAASLTFTTATWNTAQTVTVSAGEDDDGANDAATLLHTASGGDYAGETASVSVTVTDDDEVELTLSATSLGVAEGDDGEYTVRLSTQPTAQVTVAVTGQAGTDLTLDSTSLTFTTATWNTAQTVTVSAGEDDDGANDAATLLHTASGGDYAGETASVSVTVTDDDEVELTLSTTALGVTEGDDAEYTVRLSTQPTAQVTVAVTGHSGTDLSLDSTSLTFTTATWNTAQTVTVSAAEDDDGANDAATLVHTATGGDYAGETASVSVTVTDDDEVELTLSTTALGVAEGDDAEYTVRLSTQPTATVTVAVTGQASTDLTLDTASLTFTTATWNTVQTVTVTAGEDDDGANDAATLLHTASGGDYAGETASVAVTVTDDDDVELTLSTTALGVAEGDDGEYTVRLSTQPTATVTVAVTGHSGTDLTLDTASLTFTTATWNTAQTVTVSAGEDDDAANDAATLLHTASGGDYAGETASVSVTVTDDDTAGLTVSTTALGVTEGDDGEYTVRLATQPTAQVTVAITGQAGTDLTLDTASLTFTTATWNTAQTVTVSAGEDDDGANDAATLLHTASGGDYAGETASVAVTVTDDDEVELTLSTTALGVAEGADGEYTVRLATQPTATVTVAVTGHSGTDLTLDTASLTFTTATWNTAQTVTVSAGEDDDGANDAATLLHTASGGDYAGETANVAVTVTDDDDVELTLSTTALGVAEGDDGEYTVRLSTQPTATVTVAVTGHSGTDLTLDTASLTFTTATWNTAQTVTVSAGEDDDGANDAATLLHTASGGDYAGETASVAVTVTDDDEVGLTLSTTALGVAEGDDGEYTVRLATQPTAQVTVAITGTASTDLTLDTASLTFTTATWNTAQTVTVSAGEDDDAANDAATLLHTASGGDYAGETASVSVTVTDDDTAGLTVSTTALGVTEGDDGEYTVRLATQPTAQVTVAITGQAGTDLTLDTASLTFTMATWNTAQTVTVSAGEDDDGANDAATLLHTASGGDYAGETANVAVTVTDDDEVELTLSATALGVAEGDDAEYTVRLSTQPTAQVTVAITGQAGTDLTLDSISLTFTTATWNTAQTVTVSAGEDDDGANDAATLLHTASGGDYAGETASVSVTVTDDDDVELTLSATALGVAEGDDGEYTVRLATQPTATVTVAVTGHSGTDLTLDTASLTFTTATWNTAQTVTVTAGEDDDGANDAATLLHTASGGDYAGETASVSVTVTDDDEVELTLSTTALGVAEGDDAEYTVRLSTQPTATVTVAVTGHSGTDLTLDTASLTFTTATWNTAQTVTVSAGEDDDGANDAATLLHTASGGDYAGETASVSVTVTDDDEVELTLSATALGVAEGDDAEYTVRLSTQPTATVTVAVTGQASTDLTLDTASLTFTTASWNTVQTVTVTAGEDDDGANDAATLLHTASGGDYAGETASVAVTVTDDDEADLTLSTTALGVAEGGDGEYTVRLATQPSAQVTVAITGHSGTDLTLDTASLTFTTATWNTAQTVTVSAGEDDDGANDAATLLHTASGGDYAGETASVAVTVTDDDDVGLTLSTTALGITEGDDGEYTVRLATQPTAQVTVAITGQAGTDLSLDATSLTFTTATWNTAQTVTVSAGEDDDGANDAATLLHTASGGDYAGETASVAVTVTDDETVGLTLSTTALGVAEGDDGEYTVRLSTQPTAQVTVAITGHSGTDLTLDTASLTFTTASWNTVQTVTVSAGEDDDGANDAATLLHTASGGDYAGETASVAVTVTDDETVGLTVSTTALGVAEGGSNTYTVRLSTEPTAQVTVAVTGQAGTDLTLDTASLTFTTASWNTAQTVTVTAGEDDDGANDAATLLHTASGGDYAGETASVAVTVTDDESVGLTLSTTALRVAEGGSNTYTVRLATQPTAQVTVAVTGQAGTDLTLDTASLTFTTASWNTAQTVTVTAGEDDDAANDAATLLHTASGGDYAGETASVAVTVTDDESVGLTLSTTALGVTEGGSNTYTVRLATQPTAQVTIAVTGQAGTDLTLDTASLTFTTASWNTAQTVTVTAGEDDDAANDAAALLHTASGGDYAGETASVAVTVTDDDTAGLTLSTTALGVTEGDDGEYTVRLATQPSATVTVAVTGQAGTDLTLDTASLTFTTATWNTAQTVTVTAGEDDDAAADAATLLHTASGGDYAGETASVAVTVTDDESVGLTLSTTALGVAEGDDGEYTVRLSTQPTATVTVAVTGQAGTDLTLDSTSLTFTTATWNTAQTVTVSAGEDDDAANDSATLLHTASGGDYAGETASVAVTVTDDESVGLTLSTTALGVTEGDDGEYTVRLSTQPTAQVTVTITGHSGTDLTLDTASLTFTTATWNTAQTVTVSAGEDDDAANDAATLLHTASGGDYAGETASVTVTVTDDDTAGLTLSTTALGVAEGADGEYTVRLATQPTATVTVAVTGHSGTDLTLDTASLTFTTATWNTAQTVTVSAGEDDDAANDAATLLHTASGGDYAGETASVAVTVTDDETVGLTLSTTALGLTEGEDASYTVRLSTQPTAQVTVAVTGQTGTDLTLDSTSLIFTTATWNTAQTVTVSAGEDDDAANDAATLVHTASGGDYAGETASVSVTVTDDETVGLTLSTTALGLAEGDDGEYTVRLSTQPTAQVTVAVTGHSGTDLTLDTASLTFTAATWNTAQTVTVSAGEDDDADNDTATLLHTASGGDYASETAELAVTVTDDETVGIVLSTSSLGLAEGEDGTYTVRLSTEPTAQVTVAVTGHSGTDLTLDTASLTFTTATWSTAQTVTVSAAEDDDADNDTATLLHTASGGDYASETAELAVTVTDDESVGIVLSTSSLGLAEGEDGTYTVRLSTEPTAQVTVAVTGHSGTDLSLDTTSLTFTTATWNTAQTVTVSAGEDDDADDDTATLTHTASGGDYASETAELSVTVTDDESVGIVLSTSSLGLAEGEDGTYTVRLSTEPTAQVTVAVTGHSGTDLSLDTASLTFTTATWNTAQTVTVSAGEDDDADNDTATLTHTASGGDYASETAELAVTVTDDESVGLVLSTTALGVAEGADGEYTVRLSTQPTAQVTVAVTGHSGTDLSLDTTSLTFTTATWSTAQTVTVSAGEDDDADDDTATLVHTASGGDYAGETAELAVTVTDDETPETAGVVLSPSTLTVAEGEGGTYTVRLSTEPTGQVTVAVTGHSGTDLTLDTASLTFTTASWNTAQTVTVTAAQDDDAEDDEATLAHTASGGGYGSVTADLAVTVDDDEDDGEPVSGDVVLSVSPSSVSEGAGTTAVTVTATLVAGARGEATVVTVSVAEDADEYAATPSVFAVEVPADAASAAASFDLTPVDDTKDEPDQRVAITGTTEVGLSVEGTSLTLLDDDEPNRPPEFGQSSYTFDLPENASGRDTPVALGTVGASDADGDRLRYALSAGDGDRFTVSRRGGEVSYTGGGEDFESGPSEFELQVTAGDGEYEAKAQVTVRVVDAPESPEAKDDRAETPEDTPLVIDVLSNDTDPDGERLRVASVTAPENGTATVVSGGVRYEPDLNWYGEDRFSYTATDPGGLTSEATVVVTVTPVNDPPEAVDDEAETLEDVAVVVDVLANDTDVDGDPLTVVSAGPAAHGATAIVDNSVRYSPDLNWYGTDRFSYTIADPGGLTASATVTMTVLPVNDAPEAVGVIPDQTLEEGGGTATVDLTPYFTDVDGDALSYTAVSSDESAVTVAVVGATLTLSPVVTGTATVTVTAADPDGLTAVQTFGVSVGDGLVREVLTGALAALGRAHLSSARIAIGRRLEYDDGAMRLMLGGQQLTPDAWEQMGAGSLEQSHWLSLRAATLRQRRSPRDLSGTSADPRFQRMGLMGGGFGGGAGTDWGQMLLGTDVLLSFGGQGDPETPGTGVGRWRVWGQGDRQSFRWAGPDDAAGYEGDLATGYLGVDVQLTEHLLAGAAVSRSGSGSEWRQGYSSGRLGTELTVLHPYVRIGGRDTAVWALAGVGRGTAENVRTLNGRRGTSPLDLRLGLLEGRHRLGRAAGGVELSLRGEASWAELRTGSGEETVDGLAAAVRRLRTGVEATLPLGGPGGMQVAPFGAVSTRHDGGAGQTGLGLETAAGVRVSAGRMRIEAQGRRLLLHTASGYEEHGFSVTAMAGGGHYEPGLTASVRPHWGAPGYGAESLWQDHVQSYAAGPNRHDGGVDARLGYGWMLPGNRLLTPLVGYGRTGEAQRVQLGARLGVLGRFSGDLATPVEVELLGERYGRPDGGADHRVGLYGILNLGAPE